MTSLGHNARENMKATLQTIFTQNMKASTATSVEVAVDASATVLASNPNRKKFLLQNVTTVPIYVLFDSATASSTNYSFILKGGSATADGFGGAYIGDTYTGPITAIGKAVGGKLRVVEMM